HRQVRELPSECRRMSQVLHVEQKIEGHVVPFQDRQPSHNIGTDDEVIVGLVLRYVPDADELGVLLELDKLSFAIGAGEINPADDSCDEVILVGEGQSPAILLEVV